MTDYATLCWSETKDEGYVRLSKDFKQQGWILRMDALKDWIGELQQIYDSQMGKSAEDADLVWPRNESDES